MSISTTHSQTATPAARPIAWTVLLWTVQVLVAAFFIMGGLTKLGGTPEMVALFDAIGVGQWFRYVTGALELGGAVLLLVPALVGVGAALLAGVMAGAIFTHLFVIGGSATMAIVFFGVTAAITYARREQTLRTLALQER